MVVEERDDLVVAQSAFMHKLRFVGLDQLAIVRTESSALARVILNRIQDTLHIGQQFRVVGVQVLRERARAACRVELRIDFGYFSL